MAKRLKFSKDAKFEGDLLKTSEDLAPQGGGGGARGASSCPGTTRFANWSSPMKKPWKGPLKVLC